MLPKLFKQVVVSSLGIFMFFWLFVPQLYAAETTCEATVSPTSVKRLTEKELIFNINNKSAVNILWIKITSPNSDHFNIYVGGTSPGGWQPTVSEPTDIVFKEGTLTAGTNGDFGVGIVTIDEDISTENFVVETSDDANGASSTTCSGSTGVSVSGDGTAPEITAITLSDISDSSTKINWTTDELTTGEVRYGLTGDYGSTKTNANLALTHNLEITGLLANTTYRYLVHTIDYNGNVTDSDMNSFTTAKTGTTVTTTVTVVLTPTPTSTPTPTPTPVPDKTPPSISLKTDFSAPYLEAPTITGNASDNKEVNKIEYSLNDGKSWIVVDSSKNLGTKAVSFEFTPEGLEDGNYKIKVRAGDGSGNVGTSNAYTLVIDRLPPRLGAIIFTLGPQIIEPYDGKYMIALAGLDQKVTLSSVGGPTSVDFFLNTQMFSLAKNVDSGLWSGVLAFKEPGIYEPEIRMIDGADNKLEKKINPIMVLPNGVIENTEGPVENASISLYSFDLVTQRFVLWDGQAYSQDNPQKTSKEGKYKLFAPAGKYYLEIKAKGYKTLKTSIFILNQSLPINGNFVLEKAKSFKIGPFEIFLPDFGYKEVALKINMPEIPEAFKPENDVIGREWPNELVNIDFKGNKTLVTFINTWLPQASEQLKILEQLSSALDLNVVVIVPQESKSQVEIYQKRSGGKISMIADPDSELFENFNFQFLPAHLYLDQRGVIQKLKLGIFSKEELYNNF
jgi:hypothetical protein